MRLNPEIQKYAWLEFSMQRVIIMPVVLCLIFYISAQSPNYAESISFTATAILILLLGISGGHKAANSVLDEVNNNTWDFQRLSPASPMSLTLGKLIGSTLYNWYGAAMLLAVYIYFSMTIIPAYYVLCNVVLIIASALICHSAALLASLQALQTKISGRGRIQSIGAHIIGAVLGWNFASNIRIKNFDNIQTINWYGQEYSNYDFATFFSVITLLWVVGGVYWMMRSQLRMRTGPWFWMAFVIFIMFFNAGFNIPLAGSGVMPWPLSSYIAGMCLLYGMVFLEPWGGLHYRRLLDSWKAKDRKNFLNLFPRWFATFILAAIMGVLSLFQFNDSTPSLAVMASFCFAVRDIALLHYCKLLPNSRRAHAAALFYLFVLYALIPALLLAMKDKDTIALFWLIPTPDHIMKSFISSLVQAILFAVLAFQRWNKYWR